MNTPKVFRLVVLVAMLGIGSIAAGSIVPAARLVAPAWAATASKLGDLTPFSAIVTDSAAMVDKGELAGAKTRLRDLELAWDAAEAGLKPRAAADWHRVDKVIEHAFTTLRAGSPDQSACKQALADVLRIMDAPAG